MKKIIKIFIAMSLSFSAMSAYGHGGIIAKINPSKISGR